MLRKLHPRAGSRPGTLMIPKNAHETRIRVVCYDSERVDETWVENEAEFHKALEADGLVWVHVQGLSNSDMLMTVGEHFGIHPLSMEDVVNAPQRPKQEVTNGYAIAVTRSVRLCESGSPRAEQVSLVLGDGFVLSFQESHQPLFDPIVNRMQRPGARLRSHGPDYLAYALLDVVVDGYFPVLEKMGDELERLEEQILSTPHPTHLKKITRFKRQLIGLRRTTWAQRELVGELLREDSTLASEMVKTFTRDLFDHCVQIADVVDVYRETATGLVNTYLSSVGQRTNEIMKTLTIVGSIFIPLTFLAGIYGMNFEHMPELQMQWAYPSIWVLMVAITCGMLGYFYNRGWLGDMGFGAKASEEVETTQDDSLSVQTEDWDTRTTETRRAA